MKKMAMWLDKMSGYIDGCIEFYDDTKTEFYSQDYILIRNTDESGANDFGCWSYVGNVRSTTYQSINLGLGCVNKNTMQHEMLHALSFNHEHERPDRDKCIDILYENIQPLHND